MARRVLEPTLKPKVRQALGGLSGERLRQRAASSSNCRGWWKKQTNTPRTSPSRCNGAAMTECTPVACITSPSLGDRAAASTQPLTLSTCLNPKLASCVESADDHSSNGFVPEMRMSVSLSSARYTVASSARYASAAVVARISARPSSVVASAKAIDESMTNCKRFWVRSANLRASRKARPAAYLSDASTTAKLAPSSLAMRKAVLSARSGRAIIPGRDSASRKSSIGTRNSVRARPSGALQSAQARNA